MTSSPSPSRRAAARAKRRARERGIALIMVLGAIAVLTVMLAEFQDETSADVAAAMADRDGVQAEYMARSAINLARLLIACEPTIRQAITPLFAFLKKKPPQIPVWEFSDQLLGAFNDQESAKNFAGNMGLDLALGKNLGMPGGRFELVIVDEDAKVDVNLGASNEIAHIRLAKELAGLMYGLQYDALFDQRDAQGQFHDRLTTCAAIVDWADTDEDAFNCDFTQQQTASASKGVEDAYYQLQTPPYRRKNAPYDSLEELHLVNGVTDDFWANFVDPDPSNPKKRVLTVWGQGAVNVNTANAQTLLGVVCAGAPQADICIDPMQTSLFLMGVTMARGITMGAPLFATTNDFLQTMKGAGDLGPLLAMLGMKPVKFQSESEFKKSITTESKMFSIYAVGVVKGYKRETRLKITEVVDFRQAPSILTMGAPGTSGLQTPGSQSTASSTASQSTTSSAASGPISTVLQPSTGGTILYFHIE
jgi:general secretion pathway protein K